MKNLINQIKNITNLADHVNIPAAQNYIVSNIDIKGTNIWILTFAIIMASVGLNVNSIPVVIGAMLISPLMGPIMGVGLALGINDTILLKRSFKNLLIMTGVSIIASSIFFLITPLALEKPTELLARTNPTIYDVIIALFGGFAVIVEVCKKERGTAIAGAAIATALMPPLCTAGFGIANGNIGFFLGAFYLYFINSVFIALATFLTVRYLQFPMVHFSDKVKQKKVNQSITIFTIILIIPSIYSAVIVIQENRFNQNAKKFISENRNMSNSYIFDYKISHRAGKESHIDISIAGEELKPKEIDMLKKRLADFSIEEDQLTINQSNTFDPSSSLESQLAKDIFRKNEQEIKERESTIKEMQKKLDSYSSKILPSEQIAKEIRAQYPKLISITLARGEKVKTDSNTQVKGEEVIAILKLESHLTLLEHKKLEEWLAVRLNIPNIRIIEE